MCKYEVPTSRLSTVIVLQTNIQTDTTKTIYHAASWMVNKTLAKHYIQIDICLNFTYKFPVQ